MAGSTGPNIVNNGLVLNLDAANTNSFRGEPTTNLVRNTKDFSGVQYASDDEWVSSEPTRLIKSYVSNLLTPIGTGATLIYESGNTGYHHLSRFGGGDESGAHFLSCYIFPLSTITDFSIGLLADGPNSITFNLSTGEITYGGSISNRNAFLTPVNGFSGWYRVGANFEGRGGGWVGCLGYSIYSSYTGVNGGKQMYITGLQYEYKTKVTNFIDAQLTRGTTFATGGGWANLTSNSNHGELVNGSTFSTDNGGCLVFDGTNDYVVLSSPAQYLEYTFMFFIKWNTSTSFGSRAFGLDSYGTYTIFNPDNVGYHFNPLGGSPPSTTLSSGINVGYNNWCHIALTESRNNSKAIIYINGIARNETTTISSSGFLGSIYLGAQNTTAGLVANCQISNFMLYNRVLSSTEILQNYNSQKSRFGL